MKDQPTEASVDPFDVHRLRGPTARFNQLPHLRPITVQQSKGMVDGERLCGVLSGRVDGQNQNKPCLGMGHVSSALK